MTFYEQLVTQVQMENYAKHYGVYASGGTPVALSRNAPQPYEEQVKELVQKMQDADCIIVGGASGLSAAGGGDFYYEDNASYRKYFGKYAEKYGFKGAFAGTFAHWDSREEFWGYMATFLHTTQHAPVRKPYVDLDALLRGKEFFVLTTNQDTQFLRLYPECKVAEIQGDHRFFQCSRSCTDEVWDAVEPVQKISDYILAHQEEKILFLELGVGRLTPMFIQEPFWLLTKRFPKATYVSINRDHAFLPEDIEERGVAIQGDLATVLSDARAVMHRDDREEAC